MQITYYNSEPSPPFRLWSLITTTIRTILKAPNVVEHIIVEIIKSVKSIDPQHPNISLQGRNQTSEQDEASFERRRREPQGGVSGYAHQKILKTRTSEMLF